jgi:hypothetical protein
MNNFGTLKVKILHNLTEAYVSGDKKAVKEILSLIKENREFKELYLFYEEVENMYIEDKNLAESYVNNVEKLLKEKTKTVSKFSKSLDKKLIGENLVDVEVYKDLDLLAEDETLKNIDKKIVGKKRLVEHLTTKKELIESNSNFTSNENLLRIVLTTKFNTEFEKNLSEDEKKELKKILSITNEELVNDYNMLKEEVCEKLITMSLLEDDTDLKDKLSNVLTETKRMPVTKYNYYKLQQLKNGL